MLKKSDYLILNNSNLEKLLEQELNKNKSPNKAVSNLIINLFGIHNYSFELKPSPIEEIAEFIGLKPDYEKKEPLTDASLHKDGTVLFRDPSDEIECRFSLGHEVGHVIINSLEKINKDYLKRVGITREWYGPAKWYDKEYFCDRIAREFVCPKYIVNNSLIGFLKDNGGLKSETFNTISEKLQISYETLTQQLDRTQLLNELKSGVLISGFSINKYGRNPTTRIFYQALPKYFEPIEYLTSVYDLRLNFVGTFMDGFQQSGKFNGEIKLKFRKGKKEFKEFKISGENIREKDVITIFNME